MRLVEFIFVITLVVVSSVYAPVLPLWGLFQLPLGDSARQIAALKLENAGLEAKILALQLRQPAAANSLYLTAKIYSSYPFNDKHLFTIAAGRAAGIQPGQVVLAGENLLVGEVRAVYEGFSEVGSLFSPDWKSPVKIGLEGVDGLLVGGPDPKVIMIVKDRPAAEGMAVYAADKRFPYGLKIGEIKRLHPSTDGFFREAAVAVPYNFNELLEVLVVR